VTNVGRAPGAPGAAASPGPASPAAGSAATPGAAPTPVAAPPAAASPSVAEVSPAARASRPVGRWRRAGRIVGALVVAAVAVEVALIECFLVPLRVGTWPLPLAVVAAMVGNVVLARLMARVTGRGLTAVIPPLLWLVVVLVLAAPRPEGDLIVPGTWTGLAFLFLGAVAGTYGAASAALPRRRPPSRGTGSP
jgi:hypothetical protein